MSKSFTDRFSANSNYQDVYADFSFPQEQDKGLRDLISILFPTSAAGFLDAKQIWEKFKNLGSTSPSSGQTIDNKKLVSSLLRMYHYPGKLETNGIPQQIKEFYAEDNAARPSAYNAYSEEQKKSKSGFAVVDGDVLEQLFKIQLAEEKFQFNSVNEVLPSALSMILVDTPLIDLKLRNCDIVSTFLNYTPGIFASQLVPYLEATFSFERTKTGQRDSAGREVVKSNKVMSPLTFLLGQEDASAGDKGGLTTATSLIYDSYAATKTKKFYSTVNLSEDFKRQYAEIWLKSGDQNQRQQQADALFRGKVTLTDEYAQSGEYTQVTTTGMEMFTMPQTLVNMEYDQTKRYESVRNSTMPFGAIQTFVVNVTSAGFGVFSYKTANLTLKVFDRSRLNEIADFLNPSLYSRATIWMTYGWRAPGQPQSASARDNNGFHTMINESMLKKEAYSIINTSISIADDGSCTVTLSLCMKFSNELSVVSSTSATAAYDVVQDQINDKLRNIKDIAERLGLGGSGAADVRGSVLIQTALNGKLPELDASALQKEFSSLETALKNDAGNNPDLKQFQSLIKELYSVAAGAGSNKSSGAAALEGSAIRSANERFASLKKPESRKLDVWSVPNKDGKFSQNENIDHPFYKYLYKDLNKEADTGYGSFGDVSFARLFATYFASAMKSLDGLGIAAVDEYQVIFYSFNNYAGPVAATNIGEFPIDVSTLEKAYAEEVTKKRGENFTLLNFLEIVRNSQFGNVRHKAFGFSSLYDAEGKLLKDKDAEFLRKRIYNNNLGAAFTMPAVDFYVESSTTAEGISQRDLLSTYDTGSRLSSASINGAKQNGLKKIVRIHIYDKSSIPHDDAYMILQGPEGFVRLKNDWRNRVKNASDNLRKQLGKAPEVEVTTSRENTQIKLKDPDEQSKADKARASNDAREAAARKIDDEYQKEIEASKKIKKEKRQQEAREAAERNRTKKLSKLAAPVNVEDNAYVETVELQNLQIKNQLGIPKFENLKRIIAESVPTITVGSNGTLIKTINYSSEQDAALATIFIIRSRTEGKDPNAANTSAQGDLPMRVTPGQLSMTTMGCPLLEYMQQYFIDLGTGTTIDNLYNITGLTHNFAPGVFTSDIKFTFADAYGKFEGAQNVATKVNTIVRKLVNQIDDEKSVAAKNGGPKKKKKQAP
jgi:hypothetical protein